MSRYKTAQFRREWNRNAKPDSRIALDNEKLHEFLKCAHWNTGNRYIEMSWINSRDRTTRCIEF